MASIAEVEIICSSLYLDQEKPHRWRLIEPVQVTLSNGELIIIPAGFITDFASVPRLLRGLVSTIGNHNLATLIHDYLYTEQYHSRLFADWEMLYWLEQRGVSKLKRYVMYYAVRLGGRKWWQKYTKQ